MPDLPKNYRDLFLLSKFAQLRFVAQNLFFITSAIGLMLGGVWTWAPYIAVTLLVTFIDEIAGVDTTNNPHPPTKLQDAMLMLNAPLLALNATLFAYHFTSGDPLHLAAALKHMGVDLNAARQATSPIDLAIALLAQGFNWGLGLNAAHELLHRVDRPWHITLSRWIGTLGGDPWFSIHHPAIHHRYVGLIEKDPGTPRRGVSIYRFYPSVYYGNIAAGARLELNRFKRTGKSPWTFKNRFLTGWLILAAFIGYFYLIAGFKGVLVYLAGAAIGRFFLATTDYVQHYGVIRVDGEPLDPHMSWDVYHLGTNAMLYNVGRHADHHVYPLRPCGDLKTHDDTTRHPHGYLIMIAMSLIPPLFRSYMKPRLDAWDRRYATDADIAYMKANSIPCAERN